MHTASESWGSRGRRPLIPRSSRSRARSESESQWRVRGCFCAASWRWAVGRMTLTWTTASAFPAHRTRRELTRRENTAIQIVVRRPLPKARLPTRTCRAVRYCCLLTRSCGHEWRTEPALEQSKNKRSQNSKMDNAAALHGQQAEQW
jgi:hypothetical protein